MMRLRLVFTLALLLGRLLSPVAAEAQEAAKVARIGYLSANRAAGLHLQEAFLQGLRDLGYVEGRNLVIEYRDAEGKLDRLSALAAELVALKVDVIVAPAGPQDPRRLDEMEASGGRRSGLWGAWRRQRSAWTPRFFGALRNSFRLLLHRPALSESIYSDQAGEPVHCRRVRGRSIQHRWAFESFYQLFDKRRGRDALEGFALAISTVALSVLVPLVGLVVHPSAAPLGWQRLGEWPSLLFLGSGIGGLLGSALVQQQYCRQRDAIRATGAAWKEQRLGQSRPTQG